MAAEGVDIDLYADDIEQDFNADEFAGEGVDLYDDVITSAGRRDSESGEVASAERPSTPNNVENSPKVNSLNTSGDHSRNNDKDYIQPLRKHQVYIGNLTWWTSDKDIQDALTEIGVQDFAEVKFYENRANGQSKGYCVLTVGSDVSIKTIKEKLIKKSLHGQTPVVTPPTKQALNQFEAQSKTRPSPGPGGQGGGNQGGNMNMNNMMGGPRGPMMGPQMGMGGYGPRVMMGNHPGMRGPRMGPGMGPGMGPPPHRNMGPPNQPLPGQGPPGPFPPMQRPPMGPGPQNNMPPNGPPQRPPGMQMFQGPGPMGPQGMGPRGPMPPNMMDRGPPPRQDWNRPPMQPYPNQPPLQSGPPMGGPIRPQGMMPGPPPQGAPAPHMNPAFFNQGPGGPPQGPPQQYNTSPRPNPGGPYPPMDLHDSAPPLQMNEAEFEEIMGRNRTVSRSAISRAVTDAASGEFASAIETLVTAISLIKQSKVAGDDRCKILISSLQDTLAGIEAKSYGRTRERSRSRERDRHRAGGRRRERSRSRDREYRDRSRERYDYYPRERSRSREREYRERNRDERYYEDRYRERDRERERERPRVVEPDRSREREREREPEREAVHRPPRH